MRRSVLVLLAGGIASMLLSGCFIAPLRVANPLEVTVQDADTGSSIPNANVVYVVSDLHDYQCKSGRVIRTSADSKGKIDISGKRRWGLYIAAPGGLPVPAHLIAIWAPGYSTYLFGQYDGGIESKKKMCKNRKDIIEALTEIPTDSVSKDLILNPISELIGGKIKLIKISQ